MGLVSGLGHTEVIQRSHRGYTEVIQRSDRVRQRSNRSKTEVKQKSHRGQALSAEKQRTTGQYFDKHTKDIVLVGFLVADNQ